MKLFCGKWIARINGSWWRSLSISTKRWRCWTVIDLITAHSRMLPNNDHFFHSSVCRVYWWWLHQCGYKKREKCLKKALILDWFKLWHSYKRGCKHLLWIFLFSGLCLLFSDSILANAPSAFVSMATSCGRVQTACFQEKIPAGISFLPGSRWV